jgi:predicted aspartyl protease
VYDAVDTGATRTALTCALNSIDSLPVPSAIVANINSANTVITRLDTNLTTLGTAITGVTAAKGDVTTAIDAARAVFDGFSYNTSLLASNVTAFSTAPAGIQVGRRCVLCRDPVPCCRVCPVGVACRVSHRVMCLSEAWAAASRATRVLE